jgi:transposase InsO family protein
MPWQETSVMTLRQEFVLLAAQEGANMRELCRRYGISPTTGYRLLARWQQGGVAGLADRSRRPQGSPRTTPAESEAAVVALRDRHPAWGGRKLHHALRAQGVMEHVPAPSTITAILRRHGRLAPQQRPVHAYQRFEHPAPNDLWQMDFMGQPELPTGRVHPLTILDDHSRFALTVAACAHQRHELVQAHLTAAFRRYGLPHIILTDNGPPWGSSGMGGITALEAWLLRLGIEPWHGRPRHPQTQGKVERLHRTLWAEAIGPRSFTDLASAQARFETWRQTYNGERPHEALADAVPASRYSPSPRVFPEPLPPIIYGPEDLVRQVREQGDIGFRGRSWFISRGLAGLPVAVRPTPDDGCFAVWYCQRQVATIDLIDRGEGVHHVSAHPFTISPVYTVPRDDTGCTRDNTVGAHRLNHGRADQARRAGRRRRN